MRKFDISFYIKVIQKAFSKENTQEGVANLIFEPIIYSKDNILMDLTSKKISNLVNKKEDVNNDVKFASTIEKVINDTKRYFNQTVLKQLNLHMIDDICYEILNELENDETVSRRKFEELNNLYINKNIGDFLALSFLYALNRPNKINSVYHDNVDIDNIPLVYECNNKCPCCKKPLIKTIKNRNINNFKIVHIFPINLGKDSEKEFCKLEKPSNNLNSMDNKIALCSDCATSYEIEPSIEEYKLLLDKKKQLKTNIDYDNKLADVSLEADIVTIIEALEQVNYGDNKVTLSMNALRVNDKLGTNHPLLNFKITQQVLRYYRFIQDRFCDVNSFSVIASEIKLAYQKLDENKELTKEDIFERLTDWVLYKADISQSKRTASEIIVSFFVQNCEVYSNEITQ